MVFFTVEIWSKSLHLLSNWSLEFFYLTPAQKFFLSAVLNIVLMILVILMIRRARILLKNIRIKPMAQRH